jgi:hypothetical protein
LTELTGLLTELLEKVCTRVDHEQFKSVIKPTSAVGKKLKKLQSAQENELEQLRNQIEGKLENYYSEIRNFVDLVKRYAHKLDFAISNIRLVRAKTEQE